MIIILSLANLIRGVDYRVASYVFELYNPALKKAALVISALGSWIVIVSFSIIFIVYLLCKKNNSYKQNKADYVSAVFFPSALIITELLVLLMKSLIHRARPTGQLAFASGFAFPSGHAAISMALALALFFIYQDKFISMNKLLARKKKLLLFTLLMIYPLLVGLSRIYLSVHWLSDVLGGWILGVFVVAVLSLIRQQFLISKKILPEKR